MCKRFVQGIVSQSPACLRGSLKLAGSRCGRGFKVRFEVYGNWPSQNVYKVTYLSDYAQLVDFFPDTSLATAADFSKDTEAFPFAGFL